jgi:hypothetical protein
VDNDDLLYSQSEKKVIMRPEGGGKKKELNLGHWGKWVVTWLF